ncbi:MAG: pyridoxal phosphate-dependent aminotransferase [Bdellovibrio sp.]|nr:pyridoxal phosphate-dependent aminotransferase [Bdellovibrio sp.]
MLKISHRVEAIMPSKSVSMVARVIELQKKGFPIISLCVGEPDMPPPEEVMEEMYLAQKRTSCGYGPVSGHPVLREKLAEQLGKAVKRPIRAENIFISNGSKQILYNLFQTIINPGDEVIVPSPYWVTFPESIKLAGGKAVFVPCLSTHQLDLSAIRRAIGPSTRAIILNSPNNPTGAIYNTDDIFQILQWAEQFNFAVISDEAYAFLTYDQKTFTPPLTLLKNYDTEDLLNRVLTVQTFSKSYAMTGYRVGFLVASTELVKNMDKFQGHVCGNVCTPAQAAAILALTMPQDYFLQMKKTFEKRRNLAYKLFSKIFDLTPPQGAFYLFPRCDQYYTENIKTSEEFTNFILEKAQVAILPGSAFGAEHYIRISFATSEKEIEEAFHRIQKALGERR